MITAKGRGLLALLLLAALLLVSCQTNTTGLSALHTLGGGESEDAQAQVSEHDYVILPAAANDALTARAYELCEALSARTGIPATLFFDDAILPKQENVRLILLGNTTHALSYKHLHALRRDDYLCMTDEGSLILGGKSDAATVAAIDRFCETLLPYADATILVNTDQHFLIRATYDVDAITLGGFSLGDYCLVYPKKNENGEREVALALREAIADRCGFYPDVLPDSLVSEQSRIITVGACFGEPVLSDARFFATDSHVSLCGSSEHALASVAQAFCEFLFPIGTHQSLSVTIDASVAVSESAPSLSAFAALLHESDPVEDVIEAARLCQAIQAAETLFVPVDAIGASSLTYLQASLPEYSVSSLPLDGNRVLPFFYRADALTLLEERTTDGVHALRFALIGTSETVTVCHGRADTQASTDALLSTATQAVAKDELTLLFVGTPTGVSLLSSTALDPVGTTDGISESMHVLLYRPTALLSTTAVQAREADALYSFTLTHPFLRK